MTRTCTTHQAGNQGRRRITAAVAALVGMLGVFVVAGPAQAAPGDATLTASADPVVQGSSFTYTVSGSSPVCFDPDLCIVDAALDLSFYYHLGGGQATLTAVSSTQTGNCLFDHLAHVFYARCKFGNLPAGTPISMTVTVLATTVGTLNPQARVCDDYFAACYPPAYDSVTVIPASGADLAVTATDSADPVPLGDTFTYTAIVTNNGASSATSVSAVTTLSGAAATIVSAIASQGSCTITAPTVTCAVGNLASAASATVTITTEPAATGTITAAATVSATESDPDSGNNTDAETTTINNGHGCTITGTSGNDTLNGTNGADVICGLGGADSINGGNGNDTIYAGTGNDTVDGGNSDDVLYGGAGDDIMGGGNGADYLYGQAGNDTNYGETLLGALLYLFDNGDDHIYGGPGNDDLDGQNGNDVVSDVDSDDTDTMSGGLGNDSINIQDGEGGDTANGGLGNDTCTTDTGDNATSC